MKGMRWLGLGVVGLSFGLMSCSSTSPKEEVDVTTKEGASLTDEIPPAFKGCGAKMVDQYTTMISCERVKFALFKKRSTMTLDQLLDRAEEQSEPPNLVSYKFKSQPLLQSTPKDNVRGRRMTTTGLVGAEPYLEVSFVVGQYDPTMAVVATCIYETLDTPDPELEKRCTDGVFMLAQEEMPAALKAEAKGKLVGFAGKRLVVPESCTERDNSIDCGASEGVLSWFHESEQPMSLKRFMRTAEQKLPKSASTTGANVYGPYDMSCTVGGEASKCRHSGMINSDGTVTHIFMGSAVVRGENVLALCRYKEKEVGKVSLPTLCTQAMLATPVMQKN